MTHATLIHRTHTENIAAAFNESSNWKTGKLDWSIIALNPVRCANFTPCKSEQGRRWEIETVKEGKLLYFVCSRSSTTGASIQILHIIQNISAWFKIFNQFCYRFTIMSHQSPVERYFILLYTYIWLEISNSLTYYHNILVMNGLMSL